MIVGRHDSASMIKGSKKAERFVVAGLILLNFLTAILSTLLVGGPDDAFITYTFAKNLAEGHGITYYAGGPPIYGSTTLTWTLVLALAAVVGLSIPLASTLLGALFWALSYVLVYAMFREKLGWWPMLGVLVLETLSLRVEKLGQGMEAGLYTFLVLLCFYLYSRGRLGTSLLLCVVLVATRLDGGLVPLLIGGHYLLSGGTAPNSYIGGFLSRSVSLLKAGWPALLGLFGFFGFCWLYFGTVLPNTLLAKTFLWEFRPSFTPRLYFEFLSPWFTGMLSPPSPLKGIPLDEALAAAVIFFSGVGLVRAIVGWRLVDTLPLIWVPAYVLSMWVFGLTASEWYAAPTIPLIYVAFVYGMAGSASYLGSRREAAWKTLVALPAFCVGAVVFLAMLFGGAVNGYTLITKDPFGHDIPLRERHAQLAKAVDREMEKRGERSADIVTFEVGRMGFETSGRVHDIRGLVSPEVVRHGDEDPMWLVRRYDPEYLVLTDSPRYRLTRPIFRSVLFKRGYEPVYTYIYPHKPKNKIFRVFRVYHRVGETEPEQTPT
jgi:hypothetical protein